MQTTKRAICETCKRPLKTCICKLSVKVYNSIQLIIWQHPSEQNHPKGSAQLLHLCMQNSIIVIGERYSPEEVGITPETCALLYPENSVEPISKKTATKINQLLVIDGTWRKSRKILYSNPWIQKLTRISLPERSSNYRIRKSESDHQLSTFESASIALDQLEHTHHYENSLKGVFESFVSQWESFLP